MNINAVEELNRVLDELDAKIKHLESSPNRAFVLVEYETLSLFHWFNLCFKQFWDEFDRNSASQLLQYRDFILTYGQLRDKYVSLFAEQIHYLEGVLDFKDECVKELPPVIFSEENHTDVIGYYKDYYKNEKDEDGKPLFEIELDSDTHSEIIDGKDVPIDFYMFRSDIINDVHYKGLRGMYKCLNNIWGLMFAVHSYIDNLIDNYKPSSDEIFRALENESRQYAIEIGMKVERDLRRTAQGLKPSRNASLTPDVWGLVMDEEDDLYRLAISGQLQENEEKRFETIFEEQRKQLTDNSSLLQKIKNTAIDGELFDIRLSFETHNLLSSLNENNLDLFYELVLRRNIIQREMFPELKTQYDEWLNKVNVQPEESRENELSEARQSKLNEIIRIMQNGNWKLPATAENIKQLLNTIFGREMSLLEDGDEQQCEKMWDLVERGSGNRMEVVPANLAGFFLEENLLNGSPKTISDDLFGKSNNQTNNINKGKGTPGNCSIAFIAVIPFMRKYIDKIIRQA